MSRALEKIAAFDKFGSVLGLERIKELLRRVGSPQKELKIIHIAGTNGKGSVSRFVYHMLIEAGYSVGIYTSPFIEVFNERIEIDGEYISDAELEVYADIITVHARAMVEEGLLSPTEFDVVTSIAFMHFAKKRVDYVVLEVGLGGLGDSTNVVDNPLITAITSIGFDHTDRLGNSLSLIAEQKAGILKKGVPVICGYMEDEAYNVIKDRADELEAECIDLSEITYTITKTDFTGTEFMLTNNFSSISESAYTDFDANKPYYISLIGEHQVRNSIVALSIINNIVSRDLLEISQRDILSGLKNARNKGRFESINNTNIILDGAHNIDGMKAFVSTVNTLIKYDKKLIIFGVLADKEVQAMINILNLQNCEFIATEPNNDRKMSKEELKKILQQSGKIVIDSMHVNEAVQYAKENRDIYDHILFVGSLYMIGEVRRLVNA